MKRKLYTRSALALAALAGSAALLFGACKATDSAGNMSAATAVSKSGDKTSASAPAQAPAAAHPDGVRRMGPAELKTLVEGGKAVVYDTRSKMNYDQEHIRGALSMPHEEAAARAGEVPRDKTLVFYCT
ncbi:MAG TPA: rhodanese-like domain-containing protein [Pyrinomonadaceae bacterium]